FASRPRPGDGNCCCDLNLSTGLAAFHRLGPLTGRTDSDDGLAQANHWLGRATRVLHAPGLSEARFKPTMRAQHTPDHGIPPEPKAAKGASGLYLATWAVLAAAASGYMGILLLQPEWAAPLTTQSLRTEEPKPASTEVVEQLTGEIHFLRTR